VKFIPLFCIIALVFTSLTAQVEEIPEINPEALQESWLQQLYKDLEAGNNFIKMQSRLRFNEDDYNAFLALQAVNKDFKLNANIYGEQAGHLQGNFTLSRFAPKSVISQFHLGSLRPAWGTGLIFKRNSAKSGLLTISPAPHPRYYSPLGAAGVYTQGALSAYMLASYQQRSAAISNSKIDRIYPSSKDNLTKVDEAIAAGGLGYDTPDFALGTMFYYQNYDTAFSSGYYSRVLEALSVSAQVKGDILQLAAEAGIIEGKSALQATADLQFPNLAQSFGFSYREGIQLPAYSAKPFLLSSLGQRHELSWDLDFSPGKDTQLGFRNAIIRMNQSVQSSDWLSRNTVFAGLHAKPTDIYVQLTRLDRQIVATVDTSFIHTKPVHYRLKLLLDNNLNKYLQFALQFRYHYENRHNWDNNTIYWENAFIYSYKGFSATAGLKTWQGLHGIILPDEEGEAPSGTDILTSEDGRFFLAASMRWKTLRLKAELQKAWTENYQSLLVTLGI